MIGLGWPEASVDGLFPLLALSVAWSIVVIGVQAEKVNDASKAVIAMAIYGL